MCRLTCLLVVLAVGCSGKKLTTQEELTLLKIKNVENAVMGYYYKHKAFPESLDTLTERVDGGAAYLTKEAVLDQWGQSIQVDFSQLDKNGIPKITSRGEPGRNRPLTNW